MLQIPNCVIFCIFLFEGAFVICWTPGLVVLLLDGLCTSCNVMKTKRWLLLLAVLNSVMNPCIYSYKDEEMWTTFKNLMRCIGNGTRRQRSTKANARALSSGQDTGNSQPPSEETKTDDQGILKTWKLSLTWINQDFCLVKRLDVLYEDSDWSCLETITVGLRRPVLSSDKNDFLEVTLQANCSSVDLKRRR